MLEYLKIMRRAVWSNGTVVALCISFSLVWVSCLFFGKEVSQGLQRSCPKLIISWLICSMSGLHRRCYASVSYLQNQDTLKGCVLSPFWDESCGHLTFFLLLSLLPSLLPPQNLSRYLCAQLERVHALGKSL